MLYGIGLLTALIGLETPVPCLACTHVYPKSNSPYLIACGHRGAPVGRLLIPARAYPLTETARSYPYQYFSSYFPAFHRRRCPILLLTFARPPRYQPPRFLESTAGMGPDHPHDCPTPHPAVLGHCKASLHPCAKFNSRPPGVPSSMIDSLQLVQGLAR